MMKLSSKYFMLLGIVFLIQAGCSKVEIEDRSPEPFNDISEVHDVVLIEDIINNLPIVVVGHAKENQSQLDDQNEHNPVNVRPDFVFVTAFSRQLNGRTLEFEAVQNQFPVVLEDDEGNQYDVFGKVVTSSDKGENLMPVNAGVGYWFAFSSAFPGIGIHGHLEPDPDMAIDVRSIQPENTHVCSAAGFDMIHALDQPAFVSIEEAETSSNYYLSPDDRVIGLHINGTAKAYPLDILNYHEIINDVFGIEQITVSYCPLTGTAKTWKNDQQYGNFGVSGQLYNSNLLLFDRETNSRWWQIGGIALFGDHRGIPATILTHIETSWEEWTSRYPNTTVVSDQTGYGFIYDLYPYGSYAEDHSEILVPVDKFSENLIRAKDRVFAVIIGTIAKVYLPEGFM